MKGSRLKKSLLIILVSFITVIAYFCIFGITDVEAKTIKIRDPEDLKNINWKNKGFGPGHTYVIANDMTLGDGEYSTCRLTKGKFTIDFNGHTVQNANNKLGVFSISGANVIFKDSKVSSSKPSVRSYGAGAIDMTAGKLEIRSGNYIGVSNGTNNPCGLHVGGGTCVVNGGFIYGETIGADCAGGTLYINGGTFQTGFWFALADLGNANIKISKADFIGGKTTYGYRFALGAFNMNGGYYNFNNWLASGASYTRSFQTGYWNLQSSVSAYPSSFNYYAVAYNTPSLSVNNNVSWPEGTKIKKLTAGKRSLKVKWSKKSSVSGYEILLATNKKFTKNKKTVTVSNANTKSKTIKSLKSSKYYVKIRTYRNYNGMKLYSSWSKVKNKKAK